MKITKDFPQWDAWNNTIPTLRKQLWCVYHKPFKCENNKRFPTVGRLKQYYTYTRKAWGCVYHKPFKCENNKKFPTVGRLKQYYTYTRKATLVCLPSISLFVENKRLIDFVTDRKNKYLSSSENASYIFKTKQIVNTYTRK